jgi:hypothetical protein
MHFFAVWSLGSFAPRSRTQRRPLLSVALRFSAVQHALQRQNERAKSVPTSIDPSLMARSLLYDPLPGRVSRSWIGIQQSA